MAKYYLQSGTLRCIVDSHDVSRAALWAIHKTMQQITNLDDDQNLSELEPGPSAQPSDPVSPRTWIILDREIQISEVGFDREDAYRIDTMEAMMQWNRLMSSLYQLDAFLIPSC